MNILRVPFAIFFACCALSGHGFATDVLTYHNDNARTGWNSQEATLTPLNVNAHSFGLIRNLPVDGAVFAQPLYVSNAQVFSAGQRKASTIWSSSPQNMTVSTRSTPIQALFTGRFPCSDPLRSRPTG